MEGKNVFSFGKSKLNRTAINDDKRVMPGPGHYNSTKLLLQRKNPRCVIGSAKRVLGNRRKDTPGVGSYNLSKYWSLKNKTCGFSMTKKKRFRSLGVGLTRKMNRKWGRSRISLTTKRWASARNGEINSKIRPRSKGFVFNQKKREMSVELKETSPGPGDYSWNLKVIKKVKNGFSFGRNGLKTKKKENFGVGPGHYDVKLNTFKLKHGVIGKKKRVIGQQKEPTPGYYDIPSCIPNIAKYNYPAWEDRKIRI